MVSFSHAGSCQRVSPHWRKDLCNSCSSRWWCRYCRSVLVLPSSSPRVQASHSALNHLITHSETGHRPIKWNICLLKFPLSTSQLKGMLSMEHLQWRILECQITQFWVQYDHLRGIQGLTLRLTQWGNTQTATHTHTTRPVTLTHTPNVVRIRQWHVTRSLVLATVAGGILCCELLS